MLRFFVCINRIENVFYYVGKERKTKAQVLRERNAL